MLDPAWHPFNRDLAAAAAVPGCPLLLCFPFAGGGASIYTGWMRSNPRCLRVIPVQLPGREHRIAERPFTNMDALLDALMATLIQPLHGEIVLFGHSMGALITARLAQRMAVAGRPPLRLCVSGFPPPHFARVRADLHRLPQAEMLEALRRLNGLRPEVLANPELVELIVPTLYADLQLEETDLPATRKPLTCPISLFSGIDDPLLGSEEIAAWSEVTMQNTNVHRFSGDHFYLLKNLPEVLGLIEQDIVQAETVLS
jgi:medium-chain acyl-[acyl-carrier-protein] hydrolase